MNFIFYLAFNVTLILFFSSSYSGFAESGLYKKVKPGFIEILVEGRLDGSGVIVSKEGLVATAFHVVKKRQKRIEALSESLGRLRLQYVATNRGSDLALLSLPEKKEGYPYLRFANKIPEEGVEVFLMGSPIFRHSLLLRGTVARRTETYSWYDGAFTNTFPIAGIAAPGTSGGPWLNRAGEIFAIQVASVTTETGHQGINSAVAFSSVKSLLKHQRSVSVATIEAAVEELWGQSPYLIKEMPSNVKGLLFRQVSAQGVCGKAGIKDEDILLSANGKTFERIETFIKFIRSLEIGTEIKFTVCDFKGKNKKVVTIELAELK
jgi:S1-C subfamily serine protease